MIPGVAATPLTFITDMAAQYAASDLIICRAGASTIAELRDAVEVALTQRTPVIVDVPRIRKMMAGRLLAGARDSAEGRKLVDTAAALEAGAALPPFRPVNTTIGVIATTAGLGKSEAARLARLGLEGFEHALSPPHLPTDGDALFCLSVGEERAQLEALGAAAAQAVAAAIARAVLCATPLPGLPAAGDLLA